MAALPTVLASDQHGHGASSDPFHHPWQAPTKRGPLNPPRARPPAAMSFPDMASASIMVSWRGKKGSIGAPAAATVKGFAAAHAHHAQRAGHALECARGTLLLRSARPRRRPSPHGSGLRRRDRSRGPAAGPWGAMAPLRPHHHPAPWDPSPSPMVPPPPSLPPSPWCVPHAGERTAALVRSLSLSLSLRAAKPWVKHVASFFPFPASAMVKAGLACLP